MVEFLENDLILLKHELVDLLVVHLVQGEHLVGVHQDHVCLRGRPVAGLSLLPRLVLHLELLPQRLQRDGLQRVLAPLLHLLRSWWHSFEEIVGVVLQHDLLHSQLVVRRALLCSQLAGLDGAFGHGRLGDGRVLLGRLEGGDQVVPVVVHAELYLLEVHLVRQLPIGVRLLHLGAGHLLIRHMILESGLDHFEVQQPQV